MNAQDDIGPTTADEGDRLVQRVMRLHGRAAEKAMNDIESLFAPREFGRFIRKLARSDHPQRAAFLGRKAVFDMLGANAYQRFERRIICENVIVYSDGRPTEGKALLLCFAGLKARLGLPMPVLLQRIDARRFDVVVLRDQHRVRFRRGIEGFAPDFLSMVQEIERQFQPGRYQRVIALGNSMGGNPAAQYAALAGAERAIAIGARVVDDPLRLIQRVAVPCAFDPVCDCMSDRPMRGVWMYGELAVDDRRGGEDLFARAGGQRLILPGFDGHNILYSFWERGELGWLMRQLLESDLPGPRDEGRALVEIRPPRRSRWARRLKGIMRRLRRRIRRG